MFLTQINRIGKKSSGHGEKFSQSAHKRDFGDWAGQVDGNWMELNWELNPITQGFASCQKLNIKV